MADYGIKISEDGFNVLSASELNLIFTSKYKTFKVIQTGTYSANIAAAGGNTTVDILHSLGYDPGSLVFWNIGNKRFLGSHYATTVNQDVTTDFLARDDNKIRLYFDASLGTFSGNITGRYYIFADPGE